jgi:2-(1,2-epoxy-1,2-dihydrophenyl)acetyl-CoA isomerase
MNETVVYEVEDGIGTITLNRPDRLNTMNFDLLEAAVGVFERAASDEAAKVVILTGAGRGFCAGGDLSAGAGGGVASGSAIETDIGRLRRYMRTSELLHEMPKVTIAAINGACAGAGLAWACAADLRFAAASAVFNTAFLTAGLSGDFGGTWTLPRIVGPAKARELYFLPDRFSAAEAERIGLVTKALPDGELMSHVRAVARRLLGSAPIALRAIKQNFNDSLDVAFSELLNREAERHARCGHTHDAREAAKAFIEKRPARFENR